MNARFEELLCGAGYPGENERKVFPAEYEAGESLEASLFAFPRVEAGEKRAENFVAIRPIPPCRGVSAVFRRGACSIVFCRWHRRGQKHTIQRWK